jgi:hypothetical protein
MGLWTLKSIELNNEPINIELPIVFYTHDARIIANARNSKQHRHSFDFSSLYCQVYSGLSGLETKQILIGRFSKV